MGRMIRALNWKSDCLQALELGRLYESIKDLMGAADSDAVRAYGASVRKLARRKGLGSSAVNIRGWKTALPLPREICPEYLWQLQRTG